MTDARVILRVEPERNEDVFGYFTRVAQVNHMGGVGDLFEAVFGCRKRPVILADIPTLSFFCRLYPEELGRLSGISSRTVDGSRAWQIHGQWVTKEPFVASRQVKLCPACLGESSYIRGLWSLSFYTVCTRHKSSLIDCCPQCGKSLRWNRRKIRYCSCHFDLSLAVSPISNHAGCFISELIENQCGEMVGLHSLDGLNSIFHEKLAGLSLDGLCKVLWFFGHCLSQFGGYGMGHGRYKPGAREAEVIISNAMDIFCGWPCSFGECLNSIFLGRLVLKGQGGIVERSLGPVHNYVKQELQQEQFGFVTTAYERYIYEILKAFGRRHRRWQNDRQLQFDF